MLHQCVIQWVWDEVEIIHADGTTCIAIAIAGDGWQDDNVQRLTGRILVEFDYVSVEKDGFMPINVKPVKVIQLENMER
jgi:hypothetical protein